MYVIGGYVRDLLMKQESKDIDIVVLGDGIEAAKLFKKALKEPALLSFFKTYGTAQIKWKGLEIEFVGARKESYKEHSRNPEIEQGTLEDDQKRRDFTINAMSIGLNPEDYGKLYDPFNGIQDLEKKLIRTPLDPGTTFSDDPLRMMRAIRFATKFSFNIEFETFEGICEHRDRIKIVSTERITDEINKILMSEKPSIGFNLLYDSGILHHIFPEMVALHGVETVNKLSHKDNFYHTLKVIDNVCGLSDNLWLRWSALLHDIAKPATKRFDFREGWTFHGHEDKGSRMVKPIFKKLRLPLNEKMHYVEKMVLLHLRPIALSQEKVTDSAIRRIIVDAGEDINDLLMLCRADITSKNEIKVSKFIRNLDLVAEKIKDVTERDALKNWQPPVTGNHILEYFDILDPSMIGKLKNEVREAILDGQISNDLAPALKFMQQKGMEMGLVPKKKKESIIPS